MSPNHPKTYLRRFRQVQANGDHRTSFAPETIATRRNKHDRTCRIVRKVNAGDLCPAAHNGLVGGSSPPGPTTQSRVCGDFPAAGEKPPMAACAANAWSLSPVIWIWRAVWAPYSLASNSRFPVGSVQLVRRVHGTQHRRQGGGIDSRRNPNRGSAHHNLDQCASRLARQAQLAHPGAADMPRRARA